MCDPAWAGQLDALCQHFSCVATTIEAASSALEAAEQLTELTLPVVRGTERELLARYAADWWRKTPREGCIGVVGAPSSDPG